MAALALLAACGTEGGGTGGADGLPNRGVEAYTLVEIDDDGDPETDPAPWVLAAPADATGERWHSPSAATIDGVLVNLWLIDEADGTQTLTTAESSDAGRTWSSATRLFGTEEVASAALVQDEPAPTLQGPALLVGEDGAPWLIALSVGDGEGIAIARSPDGRSWTLDDAFFLKANSSEDGIRSPSLVRTDLGLELFYEATLSDGRRVIRRAIQTTTPGEPTDDEPLPEPVVKVERRGTVLAPPGPDCLDPFGTVTKCWDADGVGAPEVRWAQRRSDGTRVYRLWFTGYSGSKGDLGFAASVDGQVWSRHPNNPALDASGAEDEPTNVLVDGRFLLLYSLSPKVTTIGIALSEDNNGPPAEAF